jgi:hypothetical protein
MARLRYEGPADWPLSRQKNSTVRYSQTGILHHMTSRTWVHTGVDQLQALQRRQALQRGEQCLLSGPLQPGTQLQPHVAKVAGVRQCP